MGSKKKNNEMKGRAKDGGAADGGAADGGPDGGKHRHGNKVITDPRFASVHSDPRFREAPKHKAKVSIDSRFNRMFTDKNFDSSKARIDKRGRVKKDSSQHPLKHYYHLEEEEEEEEEVEEKKKKKKKKKRGSRGKSEKEVESDRDISEEDESDSDNDSDDDNLKKLANSRDKSESLGSRGEEEEEEEEEDDDEEEEEDEDNDDEIDSEKSSASTTDSDDDDDLYLEGEDTFVQEENVPEIDKETHRLAVVNLDWGQVKAVDLFVLLSSFLPKGGQILSLSVYPSEFGLKRMEEEAVHGPVGLFDDKKEKNEDEDDDEIDNEKLRAYELSRLRYYYAVVECDSIATADYLYKTCDGVEFERSSNKLDLRFIPDSMEFKHPPRDVAKEAPGNYEGLDFQTRALQQSNIELTWDEDEPQRAKTLKRKFNADQLADLELKEFLASDEGETEEEDTDNSTEHKSSKKHKKEDMYRALLASGDASDGDEEMDDQDMEVTFNTGLEDISKRILEKNDKKSETVWEAYLRKRRDKKKGMKKNRSKNSSDDEFSDTDQEPKEDADDFFVESTSVKGNKDGGSKKGKRNQQSAEDDEASRAELELLLADDEAKDSKLKGYNLKRKKGKDKKGKAITDEGKIPDVDLEDPRFSAMFTSPLFALDPTDPQFKRSAAYARQVAQKQQKVEGENTDRKEHTEICWQGRLGDENVAEEKDEQRKLSELSSLVRSIKMKTNKASMPSGKSRGKPKARK